MLSIYKKYLQSSCDLCTRERVLVGILVHIGEVWLSYNRLLVS